ncbi:hypothetical protein GLGCALEP_04316 [Pseudomonas sp. MM221]|nr:hypothetical protein DBADOPDK_04207 [Pseudomonas sp. MM223]CAI3807103.1 hypothetical protein GLGCALEP_04316 [Pseudomonas sp. MM221]
MSQAKERPILFSGPMVRAILEGRKTVTRRPVKGGQIPRLEYPDSPEPWIAVGQHHPRYGFVVHGKTERECAVKVGELGACPFGELGDRLWVRETWLEDPEDDGTWAYTQYMGCKGSPLSDIPKRFQKPERCIFRASWDGSALRWRPSIHMPRWASRILLEVTDVRVERLQDGEGETDSESRYVAEGIHRIHHGDGEHYYHPFKSEPGPGNWADPFDAWRELWVSINGADSWNANPWVWVVEFKRVQP